MAYVQMYFLCIDTHAYQPLSKARGMGGTLRWCAPEVLSGVGFGLGSDDSDNI